MKNFPRKEKFYLEYIMAIDRALILCAGLGTRMGDIGKILPKSLWPIYFKPMLELQIAYVKELGISTIYINTHFLHEEIEKFIKSREEYRDIVLLHEDPLLDSGGAIHNLAQRSEVSYSGNVLLVNGDQFLFFEPSFWERVQKIVNEQPRAVLIGIKVSKNDSYNETIIENGRLVEIGKPDGLRDFVTYSGLGVLNLNGLRPVQGISKFFTSVANFKSENVQMITPDQFEYWDFGTAKIYAENIFKLQKTEHQKSRMYSFLQKHHAFEGKMELFLDVNKRSINLSFASRFEEACLLYQNISRPY